MPTKCNSCTFGLEYMQTTGSSITTMLVFGSQRRRHHSCVPFIPALDYELWSCNVSRCIIFKSKYQSFCADK